MRPGERCSSMRFVFSLLLAGCAGAAASGCAGISVVHDPTPRQVLAPGNRVRVHLSQPRRTVIGTVARVSQDTLVILPQDARTELVLPAANVRKLELSLGRRSHTGKGALLGFIAGGVGVSIALAALCAGECIGGGVIIVPAGGAVGGAILGAGIGALIRSDRWREVLWR
jgi:hypothetical protein